MKTKGIRGWMRGILGLTALIVTLTSVAALEVDSGSWQPGVPLLEARSGAVAVRLADGKVLLTGGLGSSGTLASSERIGSDGASDAVAAMNVPRSGHAASLLADGRVLVTGGLGADGAALASAEIYDPVFDYWATVPAMHAARSGHDARALADGRVLIAGGAAGFGPALEVFDPAEESFSSSVLFSSAVARSQQSAVQLADGRVMVLGGSDGVAPLASTEIYDPTTGLVAEGPAMTTPRAAFSATALLDGRVLVTGGQGPAGELDSAELYDPETGAFVALAARLGIPRSGHLAVLLPNNNSVLIVSGSSGGQPIAGTELFQPKSQSFVATGSLTAARNAVAVSTLVQDGRLLLAGGSDAAGASSATDIYGFQTVKTDKKDYAPGELVTITGTGWQPGENVALLLSRTPKTAEDTALLSATDGKGNFRNTDFYTQAHDLGVMFELDANGQASGLMAAHRFTDGVLTVFAAPVNTTFSLQSKLYRTSKTCVAGNNDGNTVTSTVGSGGTSLGEVQNAGSSLLVAAAKNSTQADFQSWNCNTATPQDGWPISSTNPTFCVPGTPTNTASAVSCTATYGVVTVNTVTTITSDSPDPSVVGQGVTVNLSVARSSGSGTPSGSVVVTVSGGAETCTLTLANTATAGTAAGSCSLPLSSAGSRTLTASYGGSASFNASSDTEAHQVNAAGTTTTISSISPEPSIVGLPYTVNVAVAPVAPGSGTPTGSVKVDANDGTTCTATLAAGTGSCQITPTTAGSKSLTASYLATSDYSASSSTPASSHVVSKGTTTTTITSDAPDPSVPGQAYTVSWTVAVATGAGSPGGIVTVDDGAGHTCTGSVPTGSCSLTSYAASGYTLTASYPGDSNFTGSSGIADHTVAKGDTATTISSSLNPSTYGQTVSFTATVCPAGASSGTPSGFVDFTVDGGAAGTAMLIPGVGCPTASYASSTLTAGLHGIKASYNGDASFKASASASLPQQVNQAATTTTITNVSPTPSVVAQQTTVSFTVAVAAPGSGTPSGNVSISDGTDSCTAILPATSCAITFSRTGAKTLVATYSGDTSFLGSFSAGFPHQVNARSTLTTVVLSPTSVFVGEASTATITVTDSEANGSKSAPAGTVVVSSDSGDTITACSLIANGPASAQCTVSVTPTQLLTASHAISASYTATNFIHANSSSAPAVLTVKPRTTTTTVSLNPASVVVGQASTATVTVTDSAAAGTASTPLGSVAVSTGVGSDVLTSCSLAQDSVGVAKCTVSITPAKLAGGSRTVAASYTANDDVHSNSSGNASLTVTARATSTTVSLNPASVVVGQASTATIIVTDIESSGSKSTPAGSVLVESSNAGDTVVSNCAAISGSGAAASCTVTITPNTFGGGSRTLSASYTPNDDVHAGSSGDKTLTVSKRSTSTAISLSPPSVVTGQSSQATVTVSDTEANGVKSVPGGSLTLVSDDSGDSVGTCVLGAAGAGTASCTATITANHVGDGSHGLTATYVASDDIHKGSYGAASLAVSKANTATTLLSSLNPSTFGDGVTFTATVCAVAPGTGTPTGTVSFSVGGSVLATSPLSGSGCSTASYDSNALYAGSYPVVASYSGSVDFFGSASSTLTQVVNPKAVTTTVTAAPSPQQYSDRVTFTATVNPAAVNGLAPATMATFYIGSQSFGSASVINGVATLADKPLLETPSNPSNAQLAPGVRTVKAVFSGVNANFTVPDASSTLTITQEDARATYTGALFVGTSLSTSLSGTATLSATIQDITAVTGDAATDPYAGDIRNATVRFVNRADNSTLCTAAVGLVSAADSQTGAVSCTATLSVGSCSAAPCSDSYTVGVVVGGYYRNGAEADTVVTVSQPGTNFITGGGYLSSTSSKGLYPAQAGSKNNFGFNVKYNKAKTNLQGSINSIFRNNGRVYQIKGNSMTSLAVQTTTAGGTATFNGKANLTDITDPANTIAIDGGALLQVTMTDLGEPGKTDSIGIMLNSAKGGLLFSSNWNGTRTVEQVIAGGNLVVH